jgi:hypothetical protein
MGKDLCDLVRNDHLDLDRALLAMLEPATPNAEMVNLLDVFRLALAVHIAAESKVLDSLKARLGLPSALAMVIAQVRCEHIAQQTAAEALQWTTPGTGVWYSRVLELRVLVLDHGARAELLRWSLNDHVPLTIRRELASAYATERLRALSSTSPIHTADRVAAHVYN